MLGLDTSVVVRLLVGAPERLAKTARRRLERAVEAGEKIFVSDLVIAEAYFALQHHYGIPKLRARALLKQFVESGVVEADPATITADLSASPGAGLVDRLVHSRYRGLGAATLTFERKQGALEGAIRLRGE
jgi:predicted nucleic acid-binding protein